MTKRVRVNIRSLANTTAVRREKRNGRDVVIVPSATLPDDVVMNGIMYPANEIEKSYKSLNRTPAPAGHPLINDQFVSASDPEGINIGWIGAWNENARRENGRVFLDKVIDVERANQSETGKRVLEAIDKGEAIHTSTGLYCNLEASNGEVDYESVARDIEFDHDAILLDEQGAATPEQGVGMLVNSKGETEEIEVINSALEDAERELDWAADYAARAAEKMARVPMMERIKSAILEAVSGPERETSTNEKDEAMNDEQFKELSGEVKALSESVSGIGEAITNAMTEAMKPLTEHMNAQAEAQKAADEAKRTDLVNKLVKANVFDEESDAEGMPIPALEKLVNKAKPGKAAGLSSAFSNSKSEDDEFADYDINKMIKEDA